MHAWKICKLQLLKHFCNAKCSLTTQPIVPVSASFFRFCIFFAGSLSFLIVRPVRNSSIPYRTFLMVKRNFKTTVMGMKNIHWAQKGPFSKIFDALFPWCTSKSKNFAKYGNLKNRNKTAKKKLKNITCTTTLFFFARFPFKTIVKLRKRNQDKTVPNAFSGIPTFENGNDEYFCGHWFCSNGH